MCKRPVRNNVLHAGTVQPRRVRPPGGGWPAGSGAAPVRKMPACCRDSPGQRLTRMGRVGRAASQGRAAFGAGRAVRAHRGRARRSGITPSGLPGPGMGHPQTLDMSSGIGKFMIAAGSPPIVARGRPRLRGSSRASAPAASRQDSRVTLVTAAPHVYISDYIFLTMRRALARAYRHGSSRHRNPRSRGCPLARCPAAREQARGRWGALGRSADGRVAEDHVDRGNHGR
jgi:hypothetical protein